MEREREKFSVCGSFVLASNAEPYELKRGRKLSMIEKEVFSLKYKTMPLLDYRVGLPRRLEQNSGKEKDFLAPFDGIEIPLFRYILGQSLRHLSQSAIIFTLNEK